MEDLNNGICRITEELRVIQEQLRQAGLLTDEGRRLHRWELARRLGSFFERVQMYFFLHQQPAKLAPYRHGASHLPRRAPRPD